MLIDTDWNRYGGNTFDADGQILAISKGVLKVDLPSCSGKLLKLS